MNIFQKHALVISIEQTKDHQHAQC